MKRRQATSRKPAKTQQTIKAKRGTASKPARSRRATALSKDTEIARLTRDLAEAREQQVATSEILRAISAAPTDVQAVFETIVRNAVSLCGSLFASVFRFDGHLVHWVASHNVGLSYLDMLEATYPMRPDSSQVSGRVLLTKSVIRLEDALADPDYDHRFALAMGWRRMLGMPLLRADEPLGVIVVGWKEPGPVPKSQEELLKTFADQAVIAIENSRLFEAEQRRSLELADSLQQQTATADVLKVISRATFDLATVLNTLIKSAARLCEADHGQVFRPAGNMATYYVAADYNTTPEFKELVRTQRFVPGREGIVGRVLLEGKSVQITDVFADLEYAYHEIAIAAGYRTALGVPLLREGTPIGIVLLARVSVRPFTKKQIELAETFADQAVIAIENVRLFDEVEEKGRQLEMASRHKSQFLANMSHELRTPLNAILGYTELIGDGIYGQPPEKMLAVLKRLDSNGKHLLSLINDVLDLSKIEAGELKLSLTDYSITDMVTTVLTSVEPLAAAKRLALRSELPAGLPPAHGDERRIAQVLLNLLGNAIKFTDAGEVSVGATAGNGSYTIAVRDTGPGISQVDQAKLFQEFQQVDNSITRKKGGAGLGLAISKRIIEMHGGRIWLESTPGQGSIFSFSVPTKVEQQVGQS